MTSYLIKKNVVENLSEDLEAKQPRGDYATVDSLSESLQQNLINFTTNRILEIPQTVKLELNDGVCTIKAGTIIYVPNGFESDNTTLKFDTVEVPADITIPNDISETCMIGAYSSRMSQWRCKFVDGVCIATSGDDFPSSPINAQRHYKTNENKIYTYTTSAGWTTSTESFPIAIITYNSDKTVVSIDQLFNGFGYIGSMLFALPGVKCQFADGNNNDGTLKSFVKTIDNIIIRNNLEAETGEAICFILDGINYYAVWMCNYHISATQPNDQEGSVWFDGKKFYKKEKNGEWKQKNLFTAVRYSVNQGKVTRFAPSDVNSINCYSRADLSSLGMPSSKYIDLTLGVSGSTYIAPANGWFFMDVGLTGTTGAAQLACGVIGASAIPQTGVSPSYAFLPVYAGNVVKLTYGLSAKFNAFRFIYAQGEQ